MTRRADIPLALADQEEDRAAQAIRAGDAGATERALQRAQPLRPIAYLRAAAAAYQADPSLNPEQVSDDEADATWPSALEKADRDLSAVAHPTFVRPASAPRPSGCAHPTACGNRQPLP